MATRGCRGGGVVRAPAVLPHLADGAGLHRHDVPATPKDFTMLGVLTVPACLVASVAALWVVLQV